jgi:diphthamide biosynthesis protein 2
VQHTLAGYQWRLPLGVQPQDCGLAWVGAPDAPALLQLQLTHSTSPWAVLDPALLPPPHQAGSDGSASMAAALREGLPPEVSRALRRRYYLVQRAREARVVGILVGTLGAAGYGDAVAALRAAAAAAGKKTYTLLMGKPSPAKLANFPEIEVSLGPWRCVLLGRQKKGQRAGWPPFLPRPAVLSCCLRGPEAAAAASCRRPTQVFVLVADPQGQILDSKEYLAPIITPHEAALAFAPGGGEGQWDERAYRLDFDGVVRQAAGSAAAGGPSSQRGQPRFSLVAGGRYTGDGGGGSSGSDDDEGGLGEGAAAADPGAALALRAQQALQVSAAPAGRSDLVEHRSAADYLLHKRSWTGVEAPLVGAPHKAAELAAEGRSGRAAGYADEPGRPTPEQQQGLVGEGGAAAPRQGS